MSYFLLIGFGGALGAISRHAVNQVTLTQLGSSQLGTFIANISGSFILGLLVGFLPSNSAWSEEIKIFLAVGFLGSYTTFSTLTVATVQLVEKGNLSSALVNLGISVLMGLTAATVGIVLGKMISVQ